MILCSMTSSTRLLLYAAIAALLSTVMVLAADPQGSEPTASPSQPAISPVPVLDEKSGASLEFPRWWGTPPAGTEGAACRDAGQCVKCHEDHGTMDASHAIACVRCHRGNPQAEDPDEAHRGLLKDPGDLRVVEKTCGTCHPEETRRVQGSAMALAPRMINHTRFAFGGQKTSEALYAVRDFSGLEQVPHPSRSGNLGDDLLRRSCLRCHLSTRGSARWGEHRGQGCSACHVPYPNSPDGKPRPHTLVRSTGMTACLKCHNSNHVGADFVGLFEKDYHRGFRSPIVQGTQSPQIYGAEQHRLIGDVHFRAGMQCMDCHSIDEIHGTGEASRSPETRVRISCESCHVRGDHPAVLKSENGEMTLLKGQGRRIPAWNPASIPHNVEAHRQRLECSACHAAWSFQDYGLHLMLEERADYWKWAPTAAQNDPQIQELLTRNVGTFAELIPPREGPLAPKPMEDWEPPSMTDWLTGETRAGAWFRGWTVRRWENPPLGLNHRGKLSVMRPMYQYVVSHVDAEDRLLVDRHVPPTGGAFPALIFNPYTPHTTSRAGRPCHECHGSPKAAGLGEGVMGIAKPGHKPVWRPEQQVPGHEFVWDAIVDETGKALQRSSHPGAGPLGAEAVKKLLNPSERHRALWHKYLRGGTD
jgi:hypothetical protein